MSDNHIRSSAKLTWEEVREIRALKGKMEYKEIATIY